MIDVSLDYIVKHFEWRQFKVSVYVEVLLKLMESMQPLSVLLRFAVSEDSLNDHERRELLVLLLMMRVLGCYTTDLHQGVIDISVTAL